MAWASGGTIGSHQLKTGSTTITFTASQACAVDTYVVVLVAVDNLDTSALPDTTSVADTQSNPWSRIGYSSTTGAAASGGTVEVWASVISTALTTSSVITVTFASAPANAAAVSGWKFTFDAATVPGVVAGAGSSGTSTLDPPSMAVTSVAVGDLCIRASSCEVDFGTAWTATSGWTNFTATGTTSGSAASNMCIQGEWKIATGTSETSNPTLSAVDNSSVILALHENTNFSYQFFPFFGL